MPVSAILIEVPEDKTVEVTEAVNQMDGVEIHETGNGRLVAVTDTDDSKTDFAIIESIHSLEFVTNTSVVFNASEEAIHTFEHSPK